MTSRLLPLLLLALLAGCEKQDAPRGELINLQDTAGDGQVMTVPSDESDLRTVVRMMMLTQEVTTVSIGALLERIEQLERQCSSVRAGSS